MDATFFVAYVDGNYSISCGWDGGCPNIHYIDPLKVVAAYNDHIVLRHEIANYGDWGRYEDIDLEYRKLTDYGKAHCYWYREYNGSRSAKVIVLADNKSQAESLVRKLLEHEVPVYGLA